MSSASSTASENRTADRLRWVSFRRDDGRARGAFRQATAGDDGRRPRGCVAGHRVLARFGRKDADTLAAAYRFCERTRNRWYLVKGSPGDALPTQGDQLTKLARSLGTTGGELREQYRRVTRRARQVVERVFYGK